MMTILIIAALTWGFWLTLKYITKGVKRMVASIQDFKNQVDSQNLGTKTALDSIATKVEALKALIVAGGSPPPEQLALLDSVLSDATANNTQAQSVDASSNPPTP